MNTRCGPSDKGEEYCACGCAAYEPDYCCRIDCPHSATCREIGESREKRRNEWTLNTREIKTIGFFHIAGRGKVFTASRREHDFELLELMGSVVLINDERYKVRGIESTRGLVPGDMVGLLVSPVK